MEGIDQAVVAQLQAQKGGEKVLPLWKRLWKAYQQTGGQGVDDVLRQLTEASSGEE